MTEPTGQVQIAQSDLDGFATTINTAATTLGTVFTSLQGYIQELLAHQTASLPAGVETGVTEALSGLGAVVTSLEGLEPPAPSGS